MTLPSPKLRRICSQATRSSFTVPPTNRETLLAFGFVRNCLDTFVAQAGALVLPFIKGSVLCHNFFNPKYTKLVTQLDNDLIMRTDLPGVHKHGCSVVIVGPPIKTTKQISVRMINSQNLHGNCLPCDISCSYTGRGRFCVGIFELTKSMNQIYKNGLSDRLHATSGNYLDLFRSLFPCQDKYHWIDSKMNHREKLQVITSMSCEGKILRVNRKVKIKMNPANTIQVRVEYRHKKNCFVAEFLLNDKIFGPEMELKLIQHVFGVSCVRCGHPTLCIELL